MAQRKNKRSSIPVGSQFNPNLIDLHKFLAVVVAHSGNEAEIKTGVWQPGVRIKHKELPPTHRNRSLPTDAAIQYGLIEKGTFKATPLTRKLASLRAEELPDEFAKHILVERGGLRIVDAVRQMEAENITITGDSLAAYLTAQGFNVSIHNGAINSLRLWLSRAGVFPDSGKGNLAWAINGSAIERLVGLTEDQISELSSLSEHHLAFVDALCALGPKDEYVASEVRDLARLRTPGVRFDSGSLPNDVLKPLQSLGLIKYEAKGTRSGKSSRLWITAKFDGQVLQPFVTKAVKQLDSAISSYFNKLPEEIYKDLTSTNVAVKGRALEALTIRVMRLLGLRFVAWNNRARDTGWGEVDAVLSGIFGAAPTRWQVQCKNTPGGGRVRLETVAKEVGLVPITKATHILILANNEFTREAVKYAEQVMYESGVTIFLLGKTDFEALQRDDAAIARILRTRALEIVQNVPAGQLFSWKPSRA